MVLSLNKACTFLATDNKDTIMKMCKHTHLYFLRNFKLFHIHNWYYQFPRQATISTLLNDILSKIQERFRVLAREFQGCFKSVLRLFQGSFKGVLAKIQGCFKSGSKGVQENIKVVSWMYQGCFEIIRVISRNFQGSYKASTSFDVPFIYE